MRSKRPSRNHRAFTLVEVLVALALMALLVLSARTMAEAVITHARLAATQARSWDETLNLERHLRAIIGRAVVGESPEQRFLGRRDSVAFATYCEAPGGWQERCRVSLFLVGGDTAVRLHIGGRQRSPAALPIAGSGFRYLLSASDNLWTESWESGSSLPLAIGVVRAGDVVVLRIGSRG